MKFSYLLAVALITACSEDSRFAAPDPTVPTKPIAEHTETRYDDSAILVRCVETRHGEESQCIAEQHYMRSLGVWCGWDRWGRVWGYCKSSTIDF